VNREQLEHVLRASSTIAGDPEVLVIGSQSVLGSFAEGDLPFEATASMEADILAGRIGTVDAHPLVIQKVRTWIASNRQDP